MQDTERSKIFLDLRDLVESYDECTDLGTHLNIDKREITRWINERKTIKQVALEELSCFWDGDTSPEGDKWHTIRDAFVAIGKGGAVNNHINYLCAAATNQNVQYGQAQYILSTQRSSAFVQGNASSSHQTSHQIQLDCDPGNLRQSTTSNSSGASDKKETHIGLSLRTGKFPKQRVLFRSTQDNCQCDKAHV